ncbi:hypothetical protein FS837_008338 [Tulasnella sp. UAMH 9824]|nr:hypothetical protein FS837_008338 [Tulasnella sp. UAMH 9824]
MLQIHNEVLNLQESLKNNPAGSADRKRAEEQLYRLRSAKPGEFSDLTPPELACECVRLGIQPEHSGTRNDIWKGRWLDKEDVALMFCKEYKMGSRDHDGIRILEIAKGLDYLHNQDIMHGSLKPSNILINDDGRAVLSDFSLAKPAIVGAKNTQVNPQVNVFRYQSPEVISDNPISKASDVYSWAMTALEIITGSPPFYTWASPGKLIMHITQNETPTRSDYSSPVLDKYPQIWELFVKCWSREPTDRPTAMEVVEAIKAIPSIQ